MAAFQFGFMALAVVIDMRGPSNEMGRQLQPKKTKVRLYIYIYILAFYIAAKDVLAVLHY